MAQDGEEEGPGGPPSEEKVLAMNLLEKSITLAQLLYLYKKFTENGTITEESTLKELIEKGVKPETTRDQCCYMDWMLGKPRDSPVMVCCWWGISFRNLLLCVARHALGSMHTLEEVARKAFVEGGLAQFAIEKPYWIDVFALNHHQVHPSGHPMCQTDKLELVLAEQQELMVALDPEVQTVHQDKCLLSLGHATKLGKKVTFCGDLAPGFRLGADHLVLEQASEAVATEVKAGVRRLALQLALLAHDLEAVEQLLGAGAEPDMATSAEGETALMWAVQYARPELPRLLLQCGADPNIATVGGWTALSSAVQLGKAGLVTDLLGARADPDKASTRNGHTALLDASERGHLAAAKALLEAGANANAADTLGRTPILLAAQGQLAEICEALLASGGDPRIKDKAGRSPLLYRNLLGGSPEERGAVSSRLVSKVPPPTGSRSASKRPTGTRPSSKAPA